MGKPRGKLEAKRVHNFKLDAPHPYKIGRDQMSQEKKNIKKP